MNAEGNAIESEKYYKKAIQIDPDAPLAWQGWIKLSDNNPEKLLEIFSKQRDHYIAK